MNLQPTATTSNCDVAPDAQGDRAMLRSPFCLGRSKIPTKRWQQQYNEACFRELHQSELESPLLGEGPWIVVKPDFLTTTPVLASPPLGRGRPVSSFLIQPETASGRRRGGLRTRSKIATKRWQSRYDEAAHNNSSSDKQKKSSCGPSSPSSLCTLIDEPRLKRSSRRQKD